MDQRYFPTFYSLNSHSPTWLDSQYISRIDHFFTPRFASVTPTLRNENDDRPRLEFYPINSSVLRTVVVENYPFLIGRGDHTQLKINSTSVSREHAKLTKSPEGYLLEDMESTNGTEVNGESINEVLLEDGDTVRIAEMELTFRCPAAKSSGIERMVTQPLADKGKSETKSESLGSLTAHRNLAESLLWQSIPLSSTSVVEYETGTLLASFISIGDSIASQLRESGACGPKATACRVQQLAWMIAARHADEIADEGVLFLRFDLLAGLEQQLCAAFEMAADCVSNDRPLGILLPWEHAMQSPETIKACTQVKELGADLAFDIFTGGATCIDSMESASPELLVLAPALARNVSSNPRRKKHLEKIIARCKEASIRPVLPAGLDEEDQQEVMDLGVDLAVHQEVKHETSHIPQPVAATV